MTRLTETGVETPGGAVSARRIAVLTDYELPALGLAVPVVSHVRTFLSASRPLLPWAAALGEYVAQKMTDGRAELDDLLSPGRSFRLGSLVQRLLGKRAAFALSHGMAKMR